MTSNLNSGRRKAGASSAFQDPLEGWTNDDLLLDKTERERFRDRHPRLAEIFDCEKMQQAFEGHDQPASDARKRSRRHGTTAVVLGFLGLALTAFTPWLAKLLSFSTIFPNDPGSAERWIGGAAAALIILGTLVGLHQALIGRAKREWLIHRYWTERIRQFHFQLIVNNLEMAAAAMGGGAASYDWRSMRERELSDFLYEFEKTLKTAFERLEDDHAEEDVWVDKAWREEPQATSRTQDLVALLEGLEKLRIGVQERYAELKLKPGLLLTSDQSGVAPRCLGRLHGSDPPAHGRNRGGLCAWRGGAASVAVGNAWARWYPDGSGCCIAGAERGASAANRGGALSMVSGIGPVNSGPVRED